MISPPVRTSYRPEYGVLVTESTVAPSPRRGSTSFLIAPSCAVSAPAASAASDSRPATAKCTAREVKAVFIVCFPWLFLLIVGAACTTRTCPAHAQSAAALRPAFCRVSSIRHCAPAAAARNRCRTAAPDRRSPAASATLLPCAPAHSAPAPAHRRNRAAVRVQLPPCA